jgi:hypothetical protein
MLPLVKFSHRLRLESFEPLTGVVGCMAIKRDFCINHPDRLAIGRCVVTHHPICTECSTQYDGVNYSREGLEIMRRSRNAAPQGVWLRKYLWLVTFTLLSPLVAFEMGGCLYLLFIHLMQHR